MKRSLPVRLDSRCLGADFFRDWFDLEVFDPHGLVGQLLIVERITDGAKTHSVSRGRRPFLEGAYSVLGAKHLLG